MRLTEDTLLSRAFVERVAPAMTRVTDHDYFRRARDGALTLAQSRRALLGFYPLIEAFPRHMSATLDRMEAGPARDWLAANVKTEARHARWWIDWGRAFGLAPEDYRAGAPTEALDGPNRYLAHVSTTGSVAESVAAVNYALEGATGIWTRATLLGLSRLGDQFGYRAGDRALRWLRAHARYDDRHPVEALEVVKLYATDETSVTRAADAAIESLRYLSVALGDALAA
jgi:pyrroloquinoline quinone (PQQ) biosynthesis protein C